MQDNITLDVKFATQFQSSLSSKRFAKYLNETDSNVSVAINLYKFNTQISQSFYTYLQAWEICLRNKINDFLIWKYNDRWPFDDTRALRNLKNDDKKRIQEAIIRQKTKRKTERPTTCSIVSDLSAGFWVSQLSGAYSVPYIWKHNLKRVFPNNTIINEIELRDICAELLVLRNRIAHHEPIFHLPLVDVHKKLTKIVAAMCEATSIFAINTCNFEAMWSQNPLNCKALKSHA